GRAHIHHVFSSSERGIVASLQGAGDIEYIFAVNASSDEKSKDRLAMKAVEAKIGLEAPPHGLYDALTGGVEEGFIFRSEIVRREGPFRSGPGQMRVWARTARPLGGVQIATPIVTRELALEQSPIKLTLAASLVDN